MPAFSQQRARDATSSKLRMLLKGPRARAFRPCRVAPTAHCSKRMVRVQSKSSGAVIFVISRALFMLLKACILWSTCNLLQRRGVPVFLWSINTFPRRWTTYPHLPTALRSGNRFGHVARDTGPFLSNVQNRGTSRRPAWLRSLSRSSLMRVKGRAVFSGPESIGWVSVVVLWRLACGIHFCALQGSCFLSGPLRHHWKAGCAVPR